MKRRVLVAGGGPAGLSAAIAAADAGADVTVLERQTRFGVKLLATGAGKCNLTNLLSAEQQAARFARNRKFILPALLALPPEALRKQFALWGVPTSAPDGFHVFPDSLRAATVRDALLEQAKLRGVTLLTGQGASIDSIGEYAADAVILATGGVGYPALGGQRSGYEIALQAGHVLENPVPGMVGLRTAQAWVGQCCGTVLPKACVNAGLLGEGRGELLFTHQGISGPAVLDLSGEISFRLTTQDAFDLTFSFDAEADAALWRRRFQDFRRDHGKKRLHSFLAMYVTRELARQLAALADVPEDRMFAVLEGAAEKRLIQLLIACPLSITRTEGWEKAMVTRGGVGLAEVNRKNLRSRLQNNLYFAGEVLDVDGPCGGYNLQWAFSSGALAGRCAAEGR